MDKEAFCSVPTLRRSPRFQKRSFSFVGECERIQSPNARCCEDDNLPRRLCLSDGSTGLHTATDSEEHTVSQPQEESRNCDLGALLIDEPLEPDVMYKAYSFLHTLNKQKLRAACKSLRCRLAGNKQELLFRAFLFLSEVHDQNGDVISFLSSRSEFEGAQKFFADNALVSCNLQLVPSRDFMIEHLRAAGDKLNDNESRNLVGDKGGGNAEKDPNFSHSEFSRLIIIMRDDERAKEALFAISQELQRPMLDAGLRRDSYWDVIARRFNDTSLKVKFDFRSSLDDVDSSITPPCNRSAAVLKEQFKKARADFTKAHMKWEASGQNDPEKFVDFLSHNKNQLYATSKRAYIIFLCCQLGTPNANTLLLDSVSKGIASGGREEGLSQPSQVPSDEGNSSLRRGQKRRRKSSTSILDDIQDASKSIIEASSAVTKRFQRTSNKAASTMSLTKENSALQQLNVKSKYYGELQAAYDNLQNAMKRGDSVLIEFAQASFDEAKKVCEEVGKEQQRSDTS